MQRSLYVVLFLLIGNAVFSQELVPVFGPFVTVTPTNANGSTRPRIALVNDSVPLVTWAKTGTTGSVFVSKWNGGSFNSATQVSPVGLNIYCSAEEGGDIAARGDTAYIVFFTTDSRCYCVHSYDAGTTWSDTVRINHIPMRDAYTPDVQIDRNGNPVVVFESSDMSMANPAQMVCRSYDGGQTFSTEQAAHTSVNGIPCECCPPALLINDSMTYVVYRNNDNNRRDIVVTISSDSGMTFPIVSEVDQTNWTISACPTAGADFTFYRDSILVLWKSSNKLYFGCAQNQTGVAGPDNLLEPALPASVLQKHPSVTAIGDTVIYLWDDRRTSNYECYISILGNGAHSITTPAVVNDTTGTAENGTQQTPQMVFDGSKMHIVYQNSATGLVLYRQATIGGPVAVGENADMLPAMIIFPVPAENTLNIQFMDVIPTARFQAMIWDANGKFVAGQELSSADSQIDISELKPGTYTVQIIGQDYISTTKIIKK